MKFRGRLKCLKLLDRAERAQAGSYISYVPDTGPHKSTIRDNFLLADSDQINRDAMGLIFQSCAIATAAAEVA